MPLEPTFPTEPESAERIARPPADLVNRLHKDIADWGQEIVPDPAMEGAVGATMFDLPGSEDHSVTVLLSQEMAQQAPSQALVRIKSRSEEHTSELQSRTVI